MIGRQDDTAKFCEADLQPYSLFPNFGMVDGCQLPWSKNVMDRRDAPPHIIVCYGHTYDFRSDEGLWLKYQFSLYTGSNEFIFAYEGLNDPICINERISISSLLSETLSAVYFTLNRPGLLRIHSIRRMAVTFVRGNGCSKVCFRLIIFYSLAKQT